MNIQVYRNVSKMSVFAFQSTTRYLGFTPTAGGHDVESFSVGSRDEAPVKGLEDEVPRLRPQKMKLFCKFIREF